MIERASWAGPLGLPSRHVVEAALHVAAIVDTAGSLEADARESYWHRATGGRLPPSDLARGQALLVDVGLLVREGNLLRPTSSLMDLIGGSDEDTLCALTSHVLSSVEPRTDTRSLDRAVADLVPDAARREQLLLQLARRFDDETRSDIGVAGERLVLEAARSELEALRRLDLAREVCRVSLISDQLGYDIRAPRLNGTTRHIEVKATTNLDTADGVCVYLSRNEAETAQRDADWALVACLVEDRLIPSGALLGWWSYETLATRLPVDADDGRWESARLTLPFAEAHSGIPSAVL